MINFRPDDLFGPGWSCWFGTANLEENRNCLTNLKLAISQSNNGMSICPHMWSECVRPCAHSKCPICCTFRRTIFKLVSLLDQIDHYKDRILISNITTSHRLPTTIYLTVHMAACPPVTPMPPACLWQGAQLVNSIHRIATRQYLQSVPVNRLSSLSNEMLILILISILIGITLIELFILPA